MVAIGANAVLSGQNLEHVALNGVGGVAGVLVGGPAVVPTPPLLVELERSRRRRALFVQASVHITHNTKTQAGWMVTTVSGASSRNKRGVLRDDH